MPSTPILGLEEVDPFPVPSSPAMIQHTPSVKIPLEKKYSTETMKLNPTNIKGAISCFKKYI